MNKHLPVLITIFLIGACSMQEQDTRLVCDCDYVMQNSEKRQCYEDLDEFGNKSLVFNEKDKKFLWNGYSFPIDGLLSFGKDYIFYQRHTDAQKSYIRLDKVNLVFYETQQSFDKFIEGKYKTWKPPITTYYQCRVVEGV